MQAKAQIGIFCAVFRGLFDSHLIKADLAGPFAAQVFIGDGFEPQMAPRQLAEVVAANAVLTGFKHIGLEQGVVRDAGQCDAVISENMLVVLEMLPDLGVLRAFQPGRKARQNLRARQLLWRTGVSVGERQIRCFTG